MYEISKKFSFCASHHLKGLPKDHPCSRDHGHNYEVTITLKSEKLTEEGFVIDYREMDRIKRFIDEELDHRNLNDIIEFNPTAENLARYLYSLIKHVLGYYEYVYSVEVSETPKTSAKYYES